MIVLKCLIISLISVFNYNLIKSFVVFYGIWYLISASHVSDMIVCWLVIHFLIGSYFEISYQVLRGDNVKSCISWTVLAIFSVRDRERGLAK